MSTMDKRSELIAEFVDRLMEYMDARDKQRACYEACDTSPSYFCSTQIDAADNARKALAEAFEQVMACR